MNTLLMSAAGRFDKLNDGIFHNAVGQMSMRHTWSRVSPEQVPMYQPAAPADYI
jgi:hypothetical protein